MGWRRLAVRGAAAIAVLAGLVYAGGGQVHFSPAVFNVTNNPVTLSVADLDGDGHPDLASTSGNGKVTILLNDGAGGFTEAGTSPETVGGVGPVEMVAADLDGDSDIDLATSNTGSDDVSVLVNDGSADFAEATTSPEAVAGSEPIGIVAADLDGDRNIDLATSNADSDDVSILINDGAADFTAAGTSPEPVAGTAPFAMVTADVDGDGDSDLATANIESDDVSILINDGAADFTEAGTSPEPLAGAEPTAIVALDVDADGDSDLATANFGSTDVSVLVNAGGGDFTEAATSPETGGLGGVWITDSDFDGDGNLDLATVNVDDGTVRIFLGDGSGDFNEAAESPVATGSAPVEAVAEDLDGDGLADLAIADNGSAEVVVLLTGLAAGSPGSPGGGPPGAPAPGGTPPGSPGGAAPPSGGGTTCFGLAATVIGSDGEDRLEGTAGSDVIVALGGDDQIGGGGGVDRICGGEGDDVIDGGGSADFVDGGPGADVMAGGGGDDSLIGGDEDDGCDGGGGADTADATCETTRRVP